MPRKKTKTAPVNKHTADIPIDMQSYSARELLDEIVQLKAQNEELIAAEQEWEDSFRKYFDLYENAPAAIFVIEMNGIVTDCNQAGTELFNSSILQIVGHPFHRFLESGSFTRFCNHLKRALETGIRQVNEFALAGGGPRRFVQLQSDPLLATSGKLHRCRTVAVDITGRMQLETEVNDARIFAESILAGIREPIVVLDKETRILYVNKAFYDLFAVPFPDVLQGTSFFELDKGVWNIPDLRERILKVVEEDRPMEAFEIKRDFPRVGPKCLQISSLPMRQGETRFPRLLIGMHDITSRKREEALEALTGELDAFNYTVSHDLRAPLRIIKGFAKIIKDECAGAFSKDKNEMIEAIQRNAEKMEVMIGSLLHLSRLGRSELNKTRVDMLRLAREAFEDARQSEFNHPVELKTDPMPEVMADPALMRHVWMNLLSNAMKFTARSSPAVIEIGGRPEGDYIVYFVRDNGAGFDPAYADKLFRPFQRLHSANEFTGTGIGLTIAFKVVARHGGHMWAEGKEGEGACFYFSLPQMHDA